MSQQSESKTTDHGPYDVPFKMADGTKGIMTIAGPTLRIIIDEKEYRFERDYSGCPWLINKRGDPTDTPGERHPFWRGFYRWLRESAKVEGDLCSWTVPLKAKARRIGKRHAEFLEIPDNWDEEDGIEYV